MKLHVLLALAGLAIGFAVPVLAKEKDTADPQMAQQIRALAMKYDAAFNRNDPAAVAALYTEDAVFVTPQGNILRSAGHRKKPCKIHFQQSIWSHI